jgi:crossover junction endodeoxyribonuclease RusA
LIVINLPWPAKELHPNARGHWTKKAKAAKQARNDGAWCALASGVRTHDFKGQDSLNVSIVFEPPDKRRRDTDGMFSSMKSYLDGIADVVGVDDSKWVFTGIKRGEPKKPGMVRVEISSVASASIETKQGNEDGRTQQQRSTEGVG